MQAAEDIGVQSLHTLLPQIYTMCVLTSFSVLVLGHAGLVDTASRLVTAERQILDE